jgi:hypothetical protein
VLNHSDRNALLPLQFGAALVLGWAGGRLLPGREWGLTLTFAFVYACIFLPAAWYLFFAPNVVLPAPQQEFLIAAVAPAVPPPVMIAALGLRLSGFAFGSLCIRQSRLNRHFAR